MLNSKQRQLLRKQAHQIKAKCQVGQNGLNKEVIKCIDEMFNTEELLKIKINRVDTSDKTIVKEYAQILAQKLKCEIVYILGTTIIIYRYNDKLHQK